jgi:hypothetical protein
MAFYQEEEISYLYEFVATDTTEDIIMSIYAENEHEAWSFLRKYVKDVEPWEIESVEYEDESEEKPKGQFNDSLGLWVGNEEDTKPVDNSLTAQCIACEGTGKSTSGKDCVPCNSTGFKYGKRSQGGIIVLSNKSKSGATLSISPEASPQKSVEKPKEFTNIANNF